jgi:hypothetical protein
MKLHDIFHINYKYLSNNKIRYFLKKAAYCKNGLYG